MVLAGTMFLVVISCLLSPLGAQGKTQLHASTQRPNNCVVLDGMVTPLAWTWDDQQTTTLLPGNTINITLSKPETQSANPQPASKPTNPPASEALKTVQVCAQWSLSRGDQATSGPLTLKPLSQSVQKAQLQIQLDGMFPSGVRMPIWVKLSSLTASIPSESKEIQLSTKWLCTLISSGFLATIYFFLARAVHAFYSNSGRAPNRLKSHGWRILDPAVISAGDYGAASLANLQILWFSLIVAWIMAYAWLVTGRLLNPSLQLLGLLGISGGVNILAKSLKSGQQRISLDNWNWLVEGKFLRMETDIDPVEVARWRDFVVDRGVLDPTRYQLIIFGFLVGVNLLFGDTSILETFQIPEFFLALQAVTSGLYLFGKTVNPNTKEELEAHVNAMKSKGDASVTDDDKRYLRRTIESLYGSSAIGDELMPSKLTLP